MTATWNVPFTRLPNSLKGQCDLREIGILWLLASYGASIFPSVTKLAKEAGCDPKTFRAIRERLRAKGLIRWRERFNEYGQTSNEYQLLFSSEPSAEAVGKNSLPSEEPVGKNSPPPYQNFPTPPTENSRPPLPKIPYEQEQTKKTQLKRNSPPYPPAGGEDTRDCDWAGIWATPEPQGPRRKDIGDRIDASMPLTMNAPTPEPEPPAKGKRAGKFHPQPHDVPAELQPVADQLIDCWLHKFKNKKSKRSFSYLMGQCSQILNHKLGGMAVLKKQIEEAVISFEIRSEPWVSIRFDRWLEIAERTRRGSHGTPETPHPCSTYLRKPSDLPTD